MNLPVVTQVWNWRNVKNKSEMYPVHLRVYINPLPCRYYPIETLLNVHKDQYRSLQYLGFEFNGKDALIRPSSLSRYFWKLNYRLQRTVIMAYSPNSKDDQIFLRQIYERYTHLGERNFLTYAYKAAKEFYEDSDGLLVPGLNSLAIKRQLRNHVKILRHELSRKNIKWYSHKSQRKKPVKLKHFN